MFQTDQEEVEKRTQEALRAQEQMRQLLEESKNPGAEGPESLSESEATKGAAETNDPGPLYDGYQVYMQEVGAGNIEWKDFSMLREAAKLTKGAIPAQGPWTKQQVAELQEYVAGHQEEMRKAVENIPEDWEADAYKDALDFGSWWQDNHL